MNGAARTKPYALLCSFAVVVSVLASYPVAEIGIDDDWSYIYSAKLLALTGGVHYIGWASAMLGWMLPLGALFIRIFGFSFTVVRAAGLLIAVLNAFLLQRCFVRCGLTERNAAFAGLTILLSPLYIPLASIYMTDIAGMAVTLLCFYGCLKAVQSATVRTAATWIAFACVVDALGGTARQTAWLGVLVMVPSAGYLMRNRRLPWFSLALVWIASVAFVYGSLRWFSHQPYSLGEALVAGHIDRDLLADFAGNIVRASLALCLFVVPISIAFASSIDLSDRRVQIWLGSVLAVLVLSVVVLAQRHILVSWLAPFDGNFVTENGLIDMKEIGHRGAVLSPWIRALLTLVTLAGGMSVLAFVIATKDSLEPDVKQERSDAPKFATLAVLLLPFLGAYTALMLHRALFASLVDRYLLILMLLPAIFLVRLYQERINARIPSASIALLSVFAIYSIAANHDFFALERARVKAADQLAHIGVKRDSFFGGWEFDGWTQVDRYGWVNSPYMNTPDGFSADRPISLKMKKTPCGYGWSRVFPAIQPQYALSYDSQSCGGPSDLPPIPVHSWLPPYNAAIYTQRVNERVF